jgi:tetratricopeptide (TPR) repeat protein
LDQNLKPQHPQRLAAMRSLSRLFNANNDPADAAKIDEEVNQTIGKTFTPELNTALRQARQALFNKDDLPLAEQYGFNALKIASKNGKESLGFAEAVGLMGRIYRSEKKRDEALSCAQQALDISRRLLPDDDKTIARRLKNLGDAYLSLRRLPEAEKVLSEAIKLNVEGNNESSVSADYSDMGLAYFEDGKVENALRCLEKASSLETTKHSPEIPFRLAAIYLHEGRPEDCLKACQRALELRKSEGTDRLPNARPIWSRMVQAYLAMNDSKNAERCYKEGQKLVKSGETGSNSPDPSDRD